MLFIVFGGSNWMIEFEFVVMDTLSGCGFELGWIPIFVFRDGWSDPQQKRGVTKC